MNQRCVVLVKSKFLFLTAQTIWEIGSQAKNPSEFADAVGNSSLRDFSFTMSFVFDLWGAVTDAQQGRLHAADNLEQTQF